MGLGVEALTVHPMLSSQRETRSTAASWAAGADVASLPTGLALGVRQFLGRARDLDPTTRQAVGGRLAEQVSAYVAPAPPTGTPPYDFLAAVVATRRERDLERLRREQATRRRLTARG